MDFLKAEIANKRKAVSPSANDSSSSQPSLANKYLRRGDLEKLQDREQKRVKAILASSSSSSSSPSSYSSSSTPVPIPDTLAALSSRASPNATAIATLASTLVKEGGFNISNDEAIRRLRAKGQPIRLFGESDKERRLRLRALELIEEKGEKGVGQNDFRSALQSAESGLTLELLERRNATDKGKQQTLSENNSTNTTDTPNRGESLTNDNTNTDDSKPDATADAIAQKEKEKEKEKREGVGMDSLLDLELFKADMTKVYPIIYYTLKGLLQDWAEHLAARPDEVKQTTHGKLAAATQVQSAEYLKPLFKQLKKRALAPDVLMRISEIVHFVQKREYRNANDSYLQLSIGNAPWPIGVTMVGIHERSGREKIFSSNVAHVLNDEVSRKYIQSLKRLMTFTQTKYPPKDISMLMG